MVPPILRSTKHRDTSSLLRHPDSYHQQQQQVRKNTILVWIMRFMACIAVAVVTMVLFVLLGNRNSSNHQADDGGFRFPQNPFYHSHHNGGSTTTTTVPTNSLWNRWLYNNNNNNNYNDNNSSSSSSGYSTNIFGPQSHTIAQQRDYLRTHGAECQQALSFSSATTTTTKNHNNQLLQRFDNLPAAYATELWKYCVLYIGTANVYWDTSNAIPFVSIQEIVTTSPTTNNKNWAMILVPNPTNEFVPSDFLLHQYPLHHSFLQINEPNSKTALGMMRFLMEEESLTPSSLHQTLALYVANDMHKHRATWSFWTTLCQDTMTRTDPKVIVERNTIAPVTVRIKKTAHAQRALVHQMGEPCAAERQEPCCQVYHTTNNVLTTNKYPNELPIMVLRHSNYVSHEIVWTKPPPNDLPFSVFTNSTLQKQLQHNLLHDDLLGMPVSHLPYIATVREFPTNAPPATLQETPNYFDILLQNNCLPRDKECFKCLKLGYKEGDEGGDCTACAEQCPCYCNALCRIRPPPKRLSARWLVTLPRYRANPERLIPRIIHQTWFEPVTKDAYPNMSRLIQSFQQSGWEYEFYDDERAAQFLSAHFPIQVRQAYDALIPGAFKADLFRYCVLLIRGGVYADMDILLESNLDRVIDGTIGFVTAQDSPGETIGHRSCLWNGFMASTPGHPFLVQTIQSVVNNVRNRFTSVDYDDMLCPDPVLSVSHTVDTLFTCGPCILGASLNDVLHRHRQTGFEYGEIDLFETERNWYHETHPTMNQQQQQPIVVPIEVNDGRLSILGRTVLLKQNKDDMGSHRFTYNAKNLIVATTDMPEYDDRPKSIEHYSKSHVKFGVFGLSKLYNNQERANEEIEVTVASSFEWQDTYRK